MRVRVDCRRLSELSVLFLLAFAILWKGGKSLESTWLLTGVAGMVTFVRYWKKPDAGAMPPALWLTGMGFFLWTVLSFAFSATKNYGLDEVLRDGSLMLIFFWMADVIGEKPPASAPAQSLIYRAGAMAGRQIPNTKYQTFIDRLFLTMSIATIGACGIGFAVYAYQPVERFVGTFFDFRFQTDYWPNAWAEYLLLAWPVTVIGLRRTQPWVRMSSLAVLLSSLLLSYSRGAFLALMGQLFLWGIFTVIRSVPLRQADWRRGASFVADCFLTVLLALIFFLCANTLRSASFPVQSVAEKVTFSAAEGTSSISERRQFWDAAIALSKERPFVGWGPYSFRFVQPRFQQGIFATSDHPHNVFLKLAMERGILAMILFALFLFFLLGPRLWSLLTRAETDPVVLASTVAVLGVLAHNMIDYNLQFVGIALPLWMLLGVLAGVPSNPRPLSPVAGERGEELYKKIVRIFTLLIAILLLIIAIIEGRFLVLSSLGRHAEAAGKTDEAIGWYEQSAGQRFSRDMHLSEARLLIQKNDLSGADRLLGIALTENAEDARVWLMLAELRGREGKKDEAAEAYGNAYMRGSQNYVGSVIGLVSLLMETKDQESLSLRKQEFDTLFGAYGDAILRNVHFIALSANVEEFERLSQVMIQAYPANAAHYRDLAKGALEHAEEVRREFSGTREGFLW